jgi:hypothetical protein
MYYIFNASVELVLDSVRHVHFRRIELLKYLWSYIQYGYITVLYSNNMFRIYVRSPYPASVTKQGQAVDSCKHDNEPSGRLGGGNFPFSYA